jgi:hypothetical protein
VHQHIRVRLDSLADLIENPCSLGSDIPHTIAHDFIGDLIIPVHFCHIAHETLCHLFLAFLCNLFSKLFSLETALVIVLHEQICRRCLTGPLKLRHRPLLVRLGLILMQVCRFLTFWKLFEFGSDSVAKSVDINKSHSLFLDPLCLFNKFSLYVYYFLVRLQGGMTRP